MTSTDSAHSSLRRITLARSVSLAGIDASAIAINFGLYSMTRSPAWLAAGMLLTFGLGSLLGPIGGRIADAYDRKRLMIICEFIGASAFAAMFLFHTPTLLLALSVIATCAGLVFGPASGAVVPDLAEEGKLAQANAMVATGANIGKTVGRVGSGLVIAATGFASVFLLNAITFTISALLISTVRIGNNAKLDGIAGRLQKMRWSQPLRDPMIRPVLLSSCAATLMTGFSMTAETVLVFDFGAGAIGLGALTACWGLGMVGGTWLSGRVLNESNEMQSLLVGRIAMGLSIAAVGITPWFWTTLPCYLVGGAGGGLLLVASQGILQRNIAGSMLGQLLATTESIKTAALGLGLLCAGVVVAALGAQQTYVLVGIGVLIGAMPVAAAVKRSRAAEEVASVTGEHLALDPATA